MNFFETLNKKAEKDEIVKRIAGGIIYNNEGRILLLKRRADDFMGGILELPSGNLEGNETIQEGLIREVKEETGLNVKNIGKFVNTFDYLSGSGKKSRQFNLEVEVESTDNVFLTEHDDYAWLSYDEIETEENITDEVKYAVAISKYNRGL
ncbi:MAG: NUDIX hydrolase [Clostridia bacterium]|nr:NUDIX hydrolase [Clostridia bacterium]